TQKHCSGSYRSAKYGQGLPTIFYVFDTIINFFASARGRVMWRQCRCGVFNIISGNVAGRMTFEGVELPPKIGFLVTTGPNIAWMATSQFHPMMYLCFRGFGFG